MEDLSDEELQDSVNIIIEEIELTKEINNVLGKKQKLNKRDVTLLLSLKSKYRSTLAHKHIEYYVNKYKTSIYERVKKGLSTGIVIIIFIMMIVIAYKFHNDYDFFSNSDSTLISAIEDYNNGNVRLCSNKITFLLNHDWDGFIVYEYYLKSAEGMINDYKSAGASLYFDEYHYHDDIQKKKEDIKKGIIIYIKNLYGISNFCYDFYEYSTILDIANELNDTDVNELISTVTAYADIYESIELDIKNDRYEEALQKCYKLKSDGASCFSFAELFTTSLIKTGNNNEAFNYVLNFVNDDSTYQAKSVTIEERIALIEYILPVVDKEQYYSCMDLLNDGFLTKNIHNGIQYCHNTNYYGDDLYGDNIKEKTLQTFKSLIHQYSLYDDTYLYVLGDSIIINGNECFTVNIGKNFNNIDTIFYNPKNYDLFKISHDDGSFFELRKNDYLPPASS